LNSNPVVILDPRARPGFYQYSAFGIELIYNPVTKEIWHLLFEK
jgi:hypothetical protein